MDSHPHSPGTVTLMGSGELTRPMSKVHRWVVSQIAEPVRAVFLDTPAGFELNADDISQKACAYVTDYVGVPCSVVSFKAAGAATPQETENALRRLKRANYIFAGPGSPTYAARNWRGTPVIELVARRVDEGGHLVLASAAAIAIGRHTLPVYEIYKVGEEPHWAQGLDLLEPYGLDLAIVSHWNNAEGGTFDTRYCYMGQPRFDVLEELLPDSTAVLGIDEYTACILDLGHDEGRVMGAGGVTIRRQGHETRFEAGRSFSLEEVRSRPGVPSERRSRKSGAPSPEEAASEAEAALRRRVGTGEAGFGTATGDDADLVTVASDVCDLAQAIDQAGDAGVEETLISQGRASLRQFLIAWSSRLAPSPSEMVTSVGPFVELLIELRSQLRASKHWALADEVRDRLASLGIVLEDGPSGTTWRMQ